MAGARLGAVLRNLQTLFGTGTVGGLADAQLLERFAARRDEAAFAALVARHGAMVLAVCRGVLRCPHDAEDAFQATFLILARKAGSLRVGDSLGGWLHRVAHRVAVQANVADARRRARERKGEAMEPFRPASEGPWDDLVPRLHDEIGRLPEKYRAPIVLCDLEGLTREQAAGQLGWPPGTVAGRLARGRDLLRARLDRRGVAPAGGIAGALLMARDASASVPSAWAETAVEAATRVAAGQVLAAGALSATALDLAKEAMKAMIRSQIRRALTLTLAVGLTLTALFVTAALAWQKDEATVAITGTVVDADGRPAADVSVFGSGRTGNDNWGRVIAETRTDGEGRFRLDLPVTVGDRPAAKPGAIWAFQPGKLVASVPVGPGTVSPDVPLRLVLGPPARTAFEVRGPDGKPVAGATIRPRVLNRGLLSAPDGLAEKIEAGTVTDANGRAVLAAFLPEEVSTVFVTAAGLGSQQFGFGHRDVGTGTKVINLLPVGRVKGRLVGDPSQVRGRELMVGTNSRAHPSPWPGLVYVRTDEEGRFTVPEIAAGNLGVSLMDEDPNKPWHGKTTGEQVVEPGKTTEIELRLVEGVRVHGIVRERGTGKPIPGVKVSFGFRTDRALTTDAAGRYEGFVPPGGLYMNLAGTPEGYVSLLYGLPDTTVPKGVAEFELPTIELTRAGSVRGVVVDPQGKPVAGALIEAAWPVDEGPNRRGQRKTTVRSDGRGEFRLERVPLGAEATLMAYHLGLRTPRPVSSHVGANEPARLQIDDTHASALAGRVVDRDGRPIPGARVHLRAQKRYPSGQVEGDALVDFDGALILTSDAEGRYGTPRQLDRDGEYAAFASADGFRTERTPWVAGGSGAFPNLVLGHEDEPRLETISGRVRDRLGKPVAGAAVWISGREGRRSEVATDPQGRFRLEDVDEGPALLFVEAAGFRFHGQVADPANSPLGVTLTRTDEPSASRMTTLPPVLPHPEEVAQARRVLGPYAERVVKEGDETARFRTLSTLAAADPSRVLEAVATKPFKTDWFPDALRAGAAKGLLRMSPEEAMTVIESIEDPSRRAYGFCDACDALPSTDRPGKLRRLDQSLLAARAVMDPAHRVVAVGRIAEQWLDLGEAERATKLLREFLPVAQELPTQAWAGFARGAFAAELAQIDPEAALRLIEGLDEGPEPDRHRLNIAHELASRDPAAAERVLDSLKAPESLGRNLSRIVHAMAPRDLDRARRLTARLDRLKDEHRAFTFARPHALAMMALALADSDKPTATGLLREAFDDLKRLAIEGRRGFQDMQDAASVAAALLPVAERIDPTLVPEYFCRAASFRGSSKPSSRPRTTPDATLALFLARYDREVARVLLEPVLSRGLADAAVNRPAALRAAVAIDPRRAVALLDAMPDDPDAGLNPFKNPKNEARLDLTGILATDPEEWWDRAAEKVLHLWTVGREDIF